MVNGKKLDGAGYATFVLKILLPENEKQLAVRINDIQTAYSFFANGRKIAQNGQPGTGRETSVPFYSSVASSFEIEEPEMIISIHISNFFDRKGGIWNGIKLGRAKEIRSEYERGLWFSLFMSSAILIMGVYHLVQHLLRRTDKADLFFGLFCFLIVLRSLTTGYMLLYRLLPDVSWQFQHRLEFLSFYLALPVFLFYLRSLFSSFFHKKVLYLFVVIGSLFSAFVIFSPARLYTQTTTAYQIVTLLGGGYIIYILIRAIRNRKPGAKALLVGFAVLFAVVINDVLHANLIIHTGYFTEAGLLFFILSQAFFIAHRNALTFFTVENQADQLKKANIDYKHEIMERKRLEETLKESYEKFERSRIAIILGLAKLAEYRDEDTGAHLERIREYCKLIAEELSLKPEYTGYITDGYINDLYQSAILHDIGKVGIPDSILLKPDRLTMDEFEIMKRHTVIGGDSILNVESQINIKSFLTLGKEIAYCHHEKWDGSGYPRGLTGLQIPLSARIAAIADVYDALCSERPYKKAFSPEKAREIIIDGRGKHFDPDIVDIFIKREEDFNRIRREFREP